MSLVLVPFLASANALSTCSSSNISYATWTTSGFACEVAGLEFTNFTPGSVSTATSLLFSVATVGSVSYIALNFQNGDFTIPYTASYNVTIDQTAFVTDPTYQKITSATDAIQQAGVATASLSATLSGGASGNVVYTDNAGVGSAAPLAGITGLSASTSLITDVYTYTSGGVLNNSNTFTEADTFGPEPSTMFLMGGALVGLGVIGRKRRNRV